MLYGFDLAARSTMTDSHGVDASQLSRDNLCAMKEDGCFEEEDSTVIDYTPVRKKKPIHN